jgi:hypothetical protein
VVFQSDAQSELVRAGFFNRFLRPFELSKNLRPTHTAHTLWPNSLTHPPRGSVSFMRSNLCRLGSVRLRTNLDWNVAAGLPLPEYAAGPVGLLILPRMVAHCNCCITPDDEARDRLRREPLSN